MIFKKNKRMIDIGKMQKKGLISSPKEEPKSNIDSDGFMRVAKGDNLESIKPSQNIDLFNLAGTSSSKEEHYTKREVDEKIIKLDNKIYRLEQRIELLEKKLNIGQNRDVGPAGW